MKEDFKPQSDQVGTRYDEILLKVKIFHQNHPEVWDLFRKFTFELIKKGFKNYGAKSVFERIRWHTDRPNTEGHSTFRVNNDFTAFYARGFMKRYPFYEGFFRIRRQTSKHKEALNMFELTPEDFPYIFMGDERKGKKCMLQRIVECFIKK